MTRRRSGQSNFVDSIHLGDCVDLLRSLPDACVDLVVSSPPYNLGKEYEARRALEGYLREQSRVLAQCARVLAPTGSLFWQVGAFSHDGALIPLDIRFFPMLEEQGLIPRNRIVWIRQHGLHARRKFSCRHETMLWFTKTRDHKFHLDPIRVPQKYQNKRYWRGEKKGQYSCHPDGKNPASLRARALAAATAAVIKELIERKEQSGEGDDAPRRGAKKPAARPPKK